MAGMIAADRISCPNRAPNWHAAAAASPPRRETLAWWFNSARVAAWETARAVSGGDALLIGVLR